MTFSLFLSPLLLVGGVFWASRDAATSHGLHCPAFRRCCIKHVASPWESKRPRWTVGTCRRLAFLMADSMSPSTSSDETLLSTEEQNATCFRFVGLANDQI